MNLSVEAPATVQEFQKSQTLRLIDIVLLAPFAIYLASKSSLSKVDRQLLLATGVGILIYNGRNYLRNRNVT